MGKEDPSPKLFHPLPMPYADVLELDPVSWAVAPLLSDRGVCGQISADNGITKRSIEQEDLDSLSFAAHVAAAVIANEKKSD
jgi:hypothetical protein